MTKRLLVLVLLILISLPAEALHVRVKHSYPRSDVSIFIPTNNGDWTSAAFNWMISDLTKGLLKQGPVWWQAEIKAQPGGPQTVADHLAQQAEHNWLIGNHHSVKGIALTFSDLNMSLAIPPVPPVLPAGQDVQRINIAIDRDGRIYVEYLNRIDPFLNPGGIPVGNFTYRLDVIANATAHVATNPLKVFTHRHHPRFVYRQMANQYLYVEQDALGGTESKLPTHDDDEIWYVDHSGEKLIARVSGDKFVVSLAYNPSYKRLLDSIDYTTWDGSHWRARVSGTKFLHAPALVNGQPNHAFENTHEDGVIRYLTWDNAQWEATIR
jgi:hypothetical protein